MRPALTLHQGHTPTETESLIDRVMYVGTGVMKALEGKISVPEGLEHVRELATIASRAEALLLLRASEERKNAKA